MGHLGVVLADEERNQGSNAVDGFEAVEATPETHCDTPPRYSGVFQPAVCTTNWKDGTVAAGLVIMLLAPTLSFVAGLGFDTEPVSPAERQRLIDAFNASMAVDDAPTRPRPAAIRLTASPAFSGTGAGVTLRARF